MCQFPSFCFHIMLAIEFYVILLRAYFFLFAILIGFLIYSDHHCLLIGIIYTYCDYCFVRP